ncbi:OLC1v1006739C1 [Oldenlandia corymbosa var. corymbosa]|uniref:OLC1v1006739C1 n=1 Tax=Oldenlandia corymbosa var. corymbosa TaxID=529605 RepID=A0AAV1DKB9_OLDCO|nr:OLC1v1006739C1 [Oldenlandia corymbosa var. corymbosa]
MGVLRESWCFCNGGGKSERMKAAIFSGKGNSMARIGAAGTGFLIHRNLLLTTHANLPSVSSAETAEIRLQNGVAARLFPHRFFITSSVLDLTIVGLDAIDGDTNALVPNTHHLRSSNPNLVLGSVVYLLGCTEERKLTVGEGKVVIATDNLIKLCTDGVTWSPGSAGFDVHGNLAFMVCDPMKLATSPNTKSNSTSSSSSSSRKRDLAMQFGIPIPIIWDWLNQHWEGNLDELNKPKLPLMHLMSTGQKSEHSCASFTMRQVFKSPETENEGTSTSSVIMSKCKEEFGPSGANNSENGTCNPDHPTANDMHGILTPEINESPKITSMVRKKESTQIQLLDINFPPRIARVITSQQPTNRIQPNSDENNVRESPLLHPTGEERLSDKEHSGLLDDAEVASTGSVNGAARSEVQSSSSPVAVSEAHHEYSSEGETTMYSAETAESRNFPSPKEGRFHQVGRSQSCVNYNRWGPAQKHPAARGTMYEKQRSFMQPRKVHSQGTASRRSNDYYSPTVSSVMKKRNNLDQQPTRPRQSAVHSSPRWNF